MLQKLKILVDFDDNGYLLQIFTKPVQVRILYIQFVNRDRRDQLFSFFCRIIIRERHISLDFHMFSYYRSCSIYFLLFSIDSLVKTIVFSEVCFKNHLFSKKALVFKKVCSKNRSFSKKTLVFSSSFKQF